MARGDYGPGSKVANVHIEIDVDADLGLVVYCGAGYHVVTPSGQSHPSGLTIHAPQGVDIADSELQGLLTAAARKVAERVRQHEGVEQ